MDWRAKLQSLGLPDPPEGIITNARWIMGRDDWWVLVEGKGWFWLDSRRKVWLHSRGGPD